MNDNRSVETIQSPEFIELEPYNPLISRCQIKVLYVGENRNGSYISKDVAKKMANTLPTSPIVGAFIEDKDDFGDHGDVITIEDGEIHFSCKTRPYGFVAPDAKVWFQTFTDYDKFGNEVEHEYLMTEGYLWTGQYEEARQIIESGKGQSMELDGATLDGEWATNSKTGIEFFIINDAVFSKLCILGDDVEPCFEGASVTAAPADYTDSYESFANTLFTMMNELRYALAGTEDTERGSDMPDSQEEVSAPAEELEAMEQEAAVQEEEVREAELETADEALPEEEEEAEEEDDAQPEPEVFSVVTTTLDDLRAENEALRREVEELRAFRLNVEAQEKDALIAKYFMLSDEDKADVIANRDNLSCDEIEAKLALTYVRKNVDFSVSDDDEVEREAPLAYSFSLDDEAAADSSALADPVLEAMRDFKSDDNLF